MASENTHLLEERGENGLILPAESNENAQPSSYNKTKLGVAVLLSIIGIGAFIAFNARSEVSGAVTGFANALNTASLNAKRSTDSKSKPSHNSTKDSTHPKLKALSSKVNAPVSKPKLRKQSRNKEVCWRDCFFAFMYCRYFSKQSFTECYKKIYFFMLMLTAKAGGISDVLG